MLEVVCMPIAMESRHVTHRLPEEDWLAAVEAARECGYRGSSALGVTRDDVRPFTRLLTIADEQGRLSGRAAIDGALLHFLRGPGSGGFVLTRSAPRSLVGRR